MDKNEKTRQPNFPFINSDESFKTRKVQIYSGEDKVFLVYIDHGDIKIPNYTNGQQAYDEKTAFVRVPCETPIGWFIEGEYALILCEYLNKEYRRPFTKEEDSNA